ncbi:MAG: hypothetical protein ABFS14_12050 [Gemmatimonadota bacterium]
MRKIGFTLVALGVVGLGGCNDDPLDFDEQTAIRISTNPSFMVVRTGDSVQMVANGINAGNEPTFQAVTATVATCGGAGSISVIESDQQTSIQPPQIYEVIGGAALGGACVVVQSGSITDTVNVVVVGGTLDVTSAPTEIVAGTGSTVVVQLTGVDGTPSTPFDPADVVWSSDTPGVLTVDAAGNITSPGLSGSATITATWTGTDATGTSNQGVSLVATAPVTVLPDVPVAAAFDTTMFGAIAAGGLNQVAVLVTDQFGNQVVDSTQVLGITVVSDDPGVAAASDNFSPDALAALAVTATGVSAGVANISGTVSTSSGDFAIGPEAVFVLDPQITSLTPDNGGATGETVTIAGTGLSLAGFATTVLADGKPLGVVTADSDIQLTVGMAAFAATGAHEITVDVGGITSPGATWTANAAFDENEPGNDFTAGAVALDFPFQIEGVIGPSEFFQAFGHYDLYAITLAAPGTINVDLSWGSSANDIDVYIWEVAFGEPDGPFATAFDGVPGGPDGWSCQFAGGTVGANTESTGPCALPAGDYLVWIYDFGPGTEVYTVSGSLTP